MLCNDATVNGDELVGDPTEGALLALAPKAGLDVDELRREPAPHRRDPVRLGRQAHGHLPSGRSTTSSAS